MKAKRKRHKGKRAESQGSLDWNRDTDTEIVEVRTEGTLLLESVSMKRQAVAMLLGFAIPVALIAFLIWLLPLPVWAAAAIAAVPALPLYVKLRKMLTIGAYLMKGKPITVSWALTEEDTLILDGRAIPFSHVEKISFMEGDEHSILSPLAATIETKDSGFHFRTLRDGTEEEIEASKDSLNDFLVSINLLTDIEMEML